MTLSGISRSRGFSLVEAVVAAAIVASAAVAVAHLLAIGRRQATNSRDALHSLIVAQSKLEELRATTWSHTVAGSEFALSPNGALMADTPAFADRAGPFVRRWSVERRDPADGDVVVMSVCAFHALEATAQPEACVSTMRAKRP